MRVGAQVPGLRHDVGRLGNLRPMLSDPTRTSQRSSRGAFIHHGGYRLREDFELVGRHYAGESEVNGISTQLDNTYVGFTWWTHRSASMTSRLQVDYLFANGDTASYTGIRGFRRDGLLAQFQIEVSD